MSAASPAAAELVQQAQRESVLAAQVAHLKTENQRLRETNEALCEERERLTAQLRAKAVTPELRAMAEAATKEENRLLRATITESFTHEMSHER